MTADLNKCKTCQVWKETRGRGSKACLKCNPFREELQTIKPLDTIPDDIIEQYPDLEDGKIKDAFNGLAHLDFWQATILFQRHFLGCSERELERRWAKPYCMGYSDSALRNIVKEALEKMREIIKK